MKKKGYTLIELVAVMAILAILLGSGIAIVSIMRNLEAEVEFEGTVGEVSNILSYGKAYCRKNKVDGKIIVDIGSNSVVFKSSIKDIKIMKINPGLNVSIALNGSDVITISEDGYLKKAGSIIVSKGGKKKVITIAVGSDKVTVKPEQELVSEIEESE